MDSNPSIDTPRPRRKAVELSAFLERLRLVSEERGLTQAELARRLGIGNATVSEWFTRGRVPSGDVILRLPSILRVNGHWLLTGEGTRELPNTGADSYAQGIRDALEAAERAVRTLQARFGVSRRGERDAGDPV